MWLDFESERVDGEGKKRKGEKGQTRWMKALYVHITDAGAVGVPVLYTSSQQPW